MKDYDKIVDLFNKAQEKMQVLQLLIDEHEGEYSGYTQELYSQIWSQVMNCKTALYNALFQFYICEGFERIEKNENKA